MKEKRETLEESQQRRTYAVILLVGLLGAVLALVTNEVIGTISGFTRLIFYITIVLLASQSFLLYSRTIRVAVARETVYVGVSIILLAVFIYALYAQPSRLLEQVSLVSLYLWFPFVYLFISLAYESRGVLVRSWILYLLSVCVSLPHAIATVGSTDPFEGFQSLGQFYITSASFIAILYFFSQMKGRLRETQATADQMSLLAQTDALTNIPNRRGIEVLLGHELQRAARYDLPLSLIVFDLDHFKQLNDTLGHDAGDEVLIRVARVVESCLRGSDQLGRWGGEEFTVVTTETPFASAYQLADRIRQAIEDQEFGQEYRLSASFGVAAHHPRDSTATLFKRADVALYQAKLLGRNRVESENIHT